MEQFHNDGRSEAGRVIQIDRSSSFMITLCSPYLGCFPRSRSMLGHCSFVLACFSAIVVVWTVAKAKAKAPGANFAWWVVLHAVMFARSGPALIARLSAAFDGSNDRSLDCHGCGPAPVWNSRWMGRRGLLTAPCALPIILSGPGVWLSWISDRIIR